MTREEAIRNLIHAIRWNDMPKKEAIDIAIESLQEPCEDCISRKAVLQINESHHGEMPNHTNHQIWKEIKVLPSVTPQPKMGRWVYDKNIENWRCSECGETPKTRGYCGSDNFMAKHFKYCNHCGAKMTEVEE